MRHQFLAALVLCLLAGVACAKGQNRYGPFDAAQFGQLRDEFGPTLRSGDYERAEEIAREMVGMAQNGPVRPRGIAFHNLGTVLQRKGNIVEAEAMLRKAVSLLERNVRADAPQDTRNLVNASVDLGVLLTTRARYAEADQVLREAAARQEAWNPKHPLMVRVCNALADNLLALGRPADAETWLNKALGEMESANDKVVGQRQALSRRILARVRFVQHRDVEAESLARQSLAWVEANDAKNYGELANALTVLGNALLRLNRGAEGEQMLRRAVQASENAFGKQHPNTARITRWLAQAVALRGNGSEANALYRQAADMARTSGAPGQVVFTATGYGRFLVRQKRHEAALPYYREAMDAVDRMFAQTQGLDEETRESFVGNYDYVYRETMQLLLALHQSQPAAGHDREALAVASRTQSRLFSEMLRQADVSAFTSNPAFVALRDQRNDLDVRLTRLRQAKVMSGPDLSVEDNDDGKAAGKPMDPLAAERLRARQNKLSAQIKEVETALADVDRQLWAQFPRYMELTQPRPVTVVQLQELLKADEHLLCFYLLPRQLAIFIVGHDSFHLVMSPYAREDIGRLVKEVRRAEERAAFSLGALVELDPATLHTLYRALIEPAEPRLKAGERILIVGDGPLHTLPLEMLVTRYGEAEQQRFRDAREAKQLWLDEYATLSYLGSRYRFAYLPSLSALTSARLYKKPPVKYERELVSFADPVFEKSGRGYSDATQSALKVLSRGVRGGDAMDIPRLPETADEAREIAAIVGGRDELYLRDKAQEYTAKHADLSTTRYVHFATHGLLGGEFVEVQQALAVNEADNARQRNLQMGAKAEPTDEDPMPLLDEDAPRAPAARGQPALLLSLSGDLHGEDGLLTMGEVMQNMDLNAQLVVLSACNTAGEGAQANSGEGFAGLTRAFMYAGTKGLLVSHWSVDSKSTQLLMTETFRYLKSGAASLDALDKARQKTRESGFEADGQRIARAHPYFWAPFVYVGD
jgi:CHAT domain-containing protein/Tfp pilus assembly protein PilF